MKRLCWALILFQFAWLNVLVPGHIRGAITFARDCESGAEATASHSCCADKSSENRESGKAPTSEQRRMCAVCTTVAGYTVPPVYVFDLAPTGLAFRPPVEQPKHVESHPPLRTYDANGPPVSAIV